MFDIGFSEILLVAVVALVVIGPERLPSVARNIGRFAGRLQRYVHDIKRDFNREVEFEEIRRLQHEMETTVQSMQESMRVVESTLKQEVDRQQTTLAEVSAAVEEVPALTKIRARKKPGAKTEKPVEAEAPVSVPSGHAPSAVEDDQYRLF